MVKHVVYIQVPAKEGIQDEDAYYSVPVYARGYNLMNMDAIKAVAKRSICEEYAYENEELTAHIMDNSISNKFATENAGVDEYVVDVYGMDTHENFEDIRGNRTLF